MCSPDADSHFSRLLRGVLILPMVLLAGCLLRGNKEASLPPPPKPVAVQPSAPVQPLSIPQTAVQLPSPQPVNPDAIPPVQAAQAPAPEKTEAPPVPRTPRRTTVAGPPKPGPEAEPDTPAAPVAQEQAPPIQPILTGEEQKRIQGAIEERKREIANKLGHGKGHLSRHDQSLADRIESFLAQCVQAEQRGDYAQADTLSERAVILARELQVE